MIKHFRNREHFIGFTSGPDCAGRFYVVRLRCPLVDAAAMLTVAKGRLPKLSVFTFKKAARA